jgi:hypothetical protein
MDYRTYGQLKAKVNLDLDLEDEQFIQPEEMLGYFNAGIDEAESEIHSIYEDYFLDDSTVDLVLNQEFYDLPSNIYANKIRAVTYVNGDDIYPVNKLKSSTRFQLIQEMKTTDGTSDYRYTIKNKASFSKPMMQLVPKSRESGASRLFIDYIRNANRMIDDSSICDIPEFSEFVIQYVKCKCYEKEGHPNLPLAQAELERLRRNMIDTLSNMVPDADTTMEMDVSHYEEST